MHVPEEIIHKLDAASLRRMAEAYLSLAQWFQHRADIADTMEQAALRRRHAGISRTMSYTERDRQIYALAAEGFTDPEIGQQIGLSARQVRRVLAGMRQARRSRKPLALPRDATSTTPASSSATTSHFMRGSENSPSPGNGTTPAPNSDAETELPLAS